MSKELSDDELRAQINALIRDEIQEKGLMSMWILVKQVTGIKGRRICSERKMRI